VERELHAEGFTCPVVRTVATEGKGIAELMTALGEAGDSPARKLRAGESPAPASIDHLGIAVKSLNEALPLYESLGLTAHRETIPQEKVTVAMMDAGDSRIELLEPAAPDSPISKFLEKRGPGLHHIALRVPDLNAAIAALKAGGARLLNEPRAGAGGHLYVFVHPASTGGVLLELIEEQSK
jgi:LAO/AO transport system kinase